ncbi:MAG: hypothetical protein JXA77_14575 [Bacteroidales bacterium]|nr:hypothetical protein [Bacteroidales bacterium]MBN2818836.1 hypothetical protein [Bacteroidales bacterium]
MGKKKNTIHKISYAAIIPQIALLFLFALILQQLGINNSWLLGLSLYLLLSGYMKILVPKSHRKGLFYLRKRELEGAAFAFQKSYVFFSKYSWIDKYRAFVLFSLSEYSYKEMALMNIIYCYEQLGNKSKVNEFHNRLKKEYPENPYSKK